MWRVRRWRGKKGGERRSSRIKRREAEPGCEPGWRGCSAGTWVHTNSQPPRSSPARESEAQSTVWKRERKGGREEEENEVDRVSEEERGKSKRSDMRGKGKGEEGFMKVRGRRKQNVMNLMDGWNNVWVYGWKSWRVGEWQDKWSARKGKISKIMGKKIKEVWCGIESGVGV